MDKFVHKICKFLNDRREKYIDTWQGKLLRILECKINVKTKAKT